MKKLAVALLVVIILSGLMLTGCGPDQTIDDGLDKSKQFVYLHNWTREGVKNHFHAGSDVGPLAWFAVEGFAQFVRVSDEVVMRLASSFDHKVKNSNGDIITTVTLRDDAKWQNGDSFVADDVVAYYSLNHTQITRYLLNIKKVDDKHVDFYWNSKNEPSARLKDLLLSQDKVGTVQYKEFKVFADKSKKIIEKCPSVSASSNMLAPFNRVINGTNLEEFSANYQQFRDHAPTWFVATGPYKLLKMTSTQMLLIKNTEHYDAANIKFESIKCINGVNDLTSIYNQLESGEIDYQNSTPPLDVINSIIAKNPNMVHYKMFDPGAIGMMFNMSKPIFTNDKVREAFQYIFNRDEIKNLSNYYGVTSYYPILSMSPSEMQTYVSAEGQAYLNSNLKYTFNTAKATELLTTAGWQKTGDKWYNNGKQVKLLLGYDGSNSYFKGAAEAAASQLNGFGIATQLKREAEWGTFYKNATSMTSQMDITVGWSDLNMTFSAPGGSFFYMYDSPVADLLHLKRFTDNDGEDYTKYGNAVNLDLEALDGTIIKVADYYQTLYNIQDEAEVERVTSNLVVGVAKKNFGVQFFQNVTGAFYNVSKISGLPYVNKMLEQRNNPYTPSLGQDFIDVAKINLYYSQGLPFFDGTFAPAK